MTFLNSGVYEMDKYDKLLKWKQRFLLLINSLRIKLIFYNNTRFKGLVNIHRTVKLYGRSGGSIILGDRVFAERNCTLVAVGGKLIVGDQVFFNTNCTIVCHENISIGSECLFGPNVCVYDHDHKYGYEGISNDYKTCQVIIGANCWIGANTVILKGTHIGDHSIIGAGTVVKGDIPPHSIVYSSRELVMYQIGK